MEKVSKAWPNQNLMKISVCITTKNEESSIGRLIESLFVQTRKPDEIIIADGNSSDKTCEIIKKYPQIKLFITKKRGIAAGRNLAIQKASSPVIAMIDAGCIAKKDWLEKITKPFINNKDLLVAGYYEMPYSSPLQQVMSVYHGIPPQRFNKRSLLGYLEHKFLPSARSVAFTKSVWVKVGKFNEQLEKAGEDTEFFYNCVKTGVKIIRVKEARVVWEEILSWSLVDGIKKFYEYAKGDSKITSSHNIKISLIFLRYVFGLLCVVGGFFIPILHYLLYIFISLYLLYPVYKWHDVIKSTQGRLWLPIVQILSDFSVMAGFISGIIS